MRVVLKYEIDRFISVRASGACLGPKESMDKF